MLVISHKKLPDEYICYNIAYYCIYIYLFHTYISHKNFVVSSTVQRALFLATDTLNPKQFLRLRH